MRTIRLLLATILMMFASLFKILCVSVAPKDLKQEFKSNI